MLFDAVLCLVTSVGPQRTTDSRLHSRTTVLDILGVLIAPCRPANICTGGSEGVIDQLLAKSAVLKIQIRGEGLGVTDW